MRCFVAMGIGDDIKKPIKAMVAGLQAGIGDTKLRISWTRPESWHVTLKFLGDVKADRLGEVSQSLLQAVDVSAPFTIHAAGVATFPEGGRKPRAIVVPIKDDGESTRLAGAIDVALVPLGFAPERRPYVAHLTIARVRNHKEWGQMATELREYEAADFGRNRIDSVTLYRSQQLEGGVRYSVLQRFPLQTGA